MSVSISMNNTVHNLFQSILVTGGSELLTIL